jgi:hypothetical protein
MRSNLALWQTIAVVASSVGLLSACGLGAARPYVPPPALPSTTVSASELVFSVAAGTVSEAQMITLTNVSSETVKVHQSVIRAEKVLTFLTKSDCNRMLVPGSSCTVQVTFRSAQEGRFSAVVDFEIGNGQMHVVRLYGAASTPGTQPRSKQ